MKLTILVSSLLLALTAATAIPSEPNSQGLDPESEKVTFSYSYCQHAYWKGRCRDEVYRAYPGECNNFPLEWWGKVSSIGPRRGTICQYYTGDSCTGRYLLVPYPGFDDLSVRFNGVFNDELKSARCFPERVL